MGQNRVDEQRRACVSNVSSTWCHEGVGEILGAVFLVPVPPDEIASERSSQVRGCRTEEERSYAASQGDAKNLT